MGFITAILATLSVICVALSTVNILQVSSEPIFSDKFTWVFWMYMAGFLMLATIACLLVGRKQNSAD
ncbi:MAG: hypothetical protein ACYDG5_06825 [Dehalococcoidales bacterium]